MSITIFVTNFFNPAPDFFRYLNCSWAGDVRKFLLPVILLNKKIVHGNYIGKAMDSSAFIEHHPLHFVATFNRNIRNSSQPVVIFSC